MKYLSFIIAAPLAGRVGPDCSDQLQRSFVTGLRGALQQAPIISASSF